ncbi:cytochrome ubiquinol oxidase subunit I [Calidifontibacter sp. DB0510]|uniref:Cytochrome ubiquinol oxidase subunit I n=1 Tax=Metallococcus carri TaxID=1656884 RepID=A0A967EG43_9MICO|nr:cytochrome ubiquinol oxidase subunit I [Metallococcus carri]NHN57211.1 cytochrome ubiquinol oxidase subunit I [Metallococcus carri]NOP37986.1 cytochrome ubiquinol oxidase subunit I [Calidifontibacter sp. DB2511S]
MNTLDLARWQFAITTVYHFLFVPITIGMSAIVAYFHTRWVVKRDPEMLRLAKFFGKLFTINFALGLVTGIVQEFQFGMNWSAYSRFVGDIFGAPLAFEALLAFFLESTFLGLWIFGWGRLPEKLHAMTIWIVHIGTVLSAYFILSANSFMQNPVGWRYNPQKNRAELTDFMAVLTNKVQLVTFPHVITASYMVGGAVIMGVALYQQMRSKDPDRGMYRKATRIGAIVTLVGGLGVAVTGDAQGKIMTDVQPMKMAAAEALYDTQNRCAAFSIFTVGTPDGQSQKFAVKVPCVLSFLATGSVNGKVDGINDLKRTLPGQLQAQAKADGIPEQYVSPDQLTPTIWMTYWNFRFMIGAGMAAAFFAALTLWATRKGRTPTSRWWTPLAVVTPLLTVFGQSFGWIFTEVGRQPWLVYGVITTSSGVSPSSTTGQVLFSMIGFTLLYAVLAVIEVKLFLDYTRKGAEPFEEPRMVESDDELQFAY